MLFKMLFVMISLLSSPYSEDRIKFEDSINNAYSSYVQYINYNNEYYSINIVKGIVNNEGSYGILFHSSTPKQYSIILENNERYYEVKPTSRGDSIIIALDMNKLQKVVIHIVRNDNKEVTPPIDIENKLTLSAFSEIELFDVKDDLINGANKGCKYTNLYLYDTIKWDIVMLFVFVLVLVSCSVIIFIFMIKKKGLFSPSKRKEGVFDFKAFIQSVDVNASKNTYFDATTIEDDNQPNQNTEEDNSDLEQKEETAIIEEKPVEVYKKSNRYDEDEEIKSVGIKEHLMNLGYVTNYTLASEDEKKQIMLELMKLRDEKKISNDDYLKETYELWKK